MVVNAVLCILYSLSLQQKIGSKVIYSVAYNILLE